MKKLFIQICKLFGLELIDQNRFSSPTLNKELNQDLSIINKKSIILPLGEVKITRKVNSILIIIRMNTEIEIWDQNKKRLFEKPKIEYSVRSIKSLIKSIKIAKNLMMNKGRVLVRKSGTEPIIRVMVESEDKKLMKKCIQIIKKEIR